MEIDFLGLKIGQATPRRTVTSYKEYEISLSELSKVLGLKGKIESIKLQNEDKLLIKTVDKD